MTAHLRWVVLDTLNGSRHAQALWLYSLLIGAHFAEHIVQVAQVFLLDWPARQAGGVLGLWFPGLASSEVLHMSYNSLQLTGLILLFHGVSRAARGWWITALVFQSWHFFEHVLLQVQYLTGYYLWNAVKQQSILELFFPRLELHFVYNLLVFIPTLVAIGLCLRQERQGAAP